MKLVALSNKLVLRFTGGAYEFIQQYSTNVPEAPQNAFIDLKGRIVATFEQKKNGDDMLAIIEKQFLERLKNHLRVYLDISGTKMEETRFKAYFDLEPDTFCLREKAPQAFEIGQKKGRILLPLPEGADLSGAEVSAEEFTSFRLKHGIPVQGVDYDRELLLNVGDEEFVSYTKGCYLGQEIIARVHHLGKPPKKLTVVSGQFTFVPT